MLEHYNGGLIAIAGCEEPYAGQLHALLREEGHEVACFVAGGATPAGNKFRGLPVFQGDGWVDALLERGITNLVLATLDNEDRYQALTAATGRMNFLSYLHASALVLPDALVHPGAVLMARATVGYLAEIQPGAFLCTGAQVDHHTIVQSCAALLPGVVLCGHVTVGDRTTVGAGATVINQITIGSDCVVGAGALVRKDMPDRTRVAGVPATSI